MFCKSVLELLFTPVYPGTPIIFLKNTIIAVLYSLVLLLSVLDLSWLCLGGEGLSPWSQLQGEGRGMGMLRYLPSGGELVKMLVKFPLSPLHQNLRDFLDKSQ